MPNEKCNVGRIIVNKNITKIGSLAAKNNLFSASFSVNDDAGRYVIDKNGKIVERKKKGRLYSLGGNDPPKRKQSQLVRLKTVGTFDLCMEVTALACGFNDNLMSDRNPPPTSIVPPAVPGIVCVTQSPSIAKSEGNNDHTSANSIDTTPRNNHISTSANSLKLDDSFKSNKNKQSRSLSTSSYLINEDHLQSVSINLENLDLNKDPSTIVEKSNSQNLASNSDVIVEDLDCDVKKVNDQKSLDSDDSVFTKGIAAASTERRRTLKKSEKIIRTDSELFKEEIMRQAQSIANESSTKTSKSNSFDEKDGPNLNYSSFEDIDEDYDIKRLAPSTEDSSRNMSTDTVFSDSVDPIDLDQLEKEYKELVRSNLQREYKSDGDGLDEVGKKRHQFEMWKNQSIDFNFLDDDVDNETTDVVDFPLKQCMDDDLQNVPDETIKIRKDDENRTKSEGDKDMLCEIEQRDSFDTQESTEEEQSDKTTRSKSLQNRNDIIEEHPDNKSHSKSHDSNPLTLFEKRFGKLRKMNKLLKVKRFSTSALYDRKKSDPKIQNNQKVSPARTASKQDLSSSKMSLQSQSPKSLKNKKFLFKKRKFSFFGKSQSNNDLNLNLKSIASKISLISKSNFDISGKISASNNRLNSVGVTGKYSASNEYRSDILQCTSPLSEAFYNATGSYQLSAMELFEKFCSTDFSGLYKHEATTETIEETVVEEQTSQPPYAPNDPNWSHKGAIKKCSLRKATLLKQNSEPKFCLKNIHLEDYAGFKNYQSAYYNEQEEIDTENYDIQENEEEFPEESEHEYPEGEYYAYENSRNVSISERRKSSFSRQFEFEQPNEFEEEYFEDQDGQFYITGPDAAYRNQGIESEVDEIYLMPEKHRFGDVLSEEGENDIIIIDEIDELEETDIGEGQVTPIISKSSGASSKNELRCEYEHNKEKVLSLYKIYPKDEELSESESKKSDEEGSLLKNIISDYVKNALTSEQILPRTKSVELLSNSSETVITNSNSEFDTVKQLNLDSCSTSRLSLSLKSDIFDDFTLAPPDTIVKTVKINEMDDFTITPDGSLAEKYDTSVDGSKLSEQEIIKNELQAQYTIIDCDEELENDDDSENTKYTDGKSSFADALNKEFDKLFTRARNQSSVEDFDTDVSATTPSIATTVVTAIKIPSRCSMDKLEPYTVDADILDDDEPVNASHSHVSYAETKATKMSQSMTSTCESIATKREEKSSNNKSKRSHSLGNIHKRKSNKCTPL